MSDFLQSGIYSFNLNLTQLILYENTSEIYDISQTNINKSKKKSLISYIYKMIAKKKWNIQNQKGYFEGTKLLIPNNDTGFKVFDEHHVLTYYHDITCKNKIMENRDKISCVFSIPQIVENRYNYVIEEKITNHNFDANHFICYLFESYIEFFQQKQICIQQDLSGYKTKYKKLFKKFYHYFENIPSKQTILQHGDIWNGNILLDDQYYIIDFEICKNRFYLYDFFFYLYSYLFIYDDCTYLDYYFRGDYDTILSIYCDALGVFYDAGCKGLYFKQFMLNFIEDRFQDYSIRIFYKESKKIIALFDKYNVT